MRINRKQTIKAVKKLVKDYIRSLEENNFNITKAFIYGSYAKGTFHKGSDIDVCIISRKCDPNDDDIQLSLWRRGRDIDVRIEPIGYRPQDFKRYDPLVHEIITHGIRIK